eukprot:GFUD01076588.1.p1 GENE.GFUD01076588.1~~GFUD01076588.1.p1  ORF type:complete len:103 (-),score=7.61 GFUD01076588.1:147-455(-)
MGCKSDLYLVVDIEPFWMVINLVSLQGYSGHEPERLIKVFKDKLLVKGVSVLYHTPTFLKKWFKLCFAFLLIELRNHFSRPVTTCRNWMKVEQMTLRRVDGL